MDSHQMPDLLPCPFCGSVNPWLSLPTCNRSSPYNPSDRAYPMVSCRACYAAAIGVNWDHKGDTAIAAWNRRVGRGEQHEAPLEERTYAGTDVKLGSDGGK
jgi:hypothetical protein